MIPIQLNQIMVYFVDNTTLCRPKATRSRHAAQFCDRLPLT